MKHKRILHVVDHTTDQKTTGYSVRTNHILTTQVRMGFEPIVVAITPRQDGDDGARVDGVEYVYRSGPQFTFSRYRPYVRSWAETIAREAAAHHADLIHAHSPFHCALPAAVAARTLGLAFINEVRGLWYESVKVENDSLTKKVGFWLRRRAERSACRDASRVIVISEGLRRHVIELFDLSPDRVDVIPNGVEFDRFRNFGGSARPGLLPGDGAILLGYIGTVRRLEGLHVAIEGISRRGDKEPRLHLVVIGDGAERSVLEAQVKSLGVSDRVTFLGHVPHAEIAAYYEHIDVLLFPRSRSAVTEIVTPLKPLEAEAMGKVILASDVHGLKELIPSPEFLFRADDVDDFLRRLETMTSDLERFKAMTERNRAFAESRDWRHTCEGYAAIYDKAHPG